MTSDKWKEQSPPPEGLTSSLYEILEFSCLMCGDEAHVVAWDYDGTFTLYYEYAPQKFELCRRYTVPRAVDHGAALRFSRACLMVYFADRER